MQEGQLKNGGKDMTVTEARNICRQFYKKTAPTEEDIFMFTEAMEYLITKTGDPNYMVDLGAMYYEQKRFDLALKYYEMAAESDNIYAISNLGYIWYYGRTGTRDYEKAFYYFDKAAKMGDMIAAYKVADMYKNGYFVEKDREKYKRTIEELYKKLKKKKYFRTNDPIPEIYTRLAAIRTEEGKTEEALALYDVARDCLAQRIKYNPFFGSLNIMKWMISDIYKLRAFNPEFMDLFDLYHVLKEPATAAFTCEGRSHAVEAVPEEDGIAIRFDDIWYRNVDDFFAKAKADGELLTSIYEELYDWEVNDGTDQNGQGKV
ncbi:MAG: sel1 repeat family protein [Lachnospiraceae bacterium]|nr:sel1 repeat family protein [Lachnospiraceae bacterium]